MIELSPCQSDEIGAFLQACEAAFGHDARPDVIERVERLIDPRRTIAAREGSAIVGTAAAYPFVLTVPGGEAPAAGVTMVGVLPSHRRRGLLRKMMQEQLHDVHDRGEPLAILWASESAIYQRFGYGPGTMSLRVEIARDRALWLRERTDPVSSRLLSEEEALEELPPVYEVARKTIPGMLARSREWWANHRLPDPEHSRDGGGPLFRALIESDGRPAAYALYRVHSRWENTFPEGTLEVREAVSTSPASARDLWRFLSGVDLVARVRYFWEPVDSQLLLSTLEVNRLKARIHDGLWLRLVDVPAALAARGYAQDGRIVLEVRDGVCHWNQGTWAIEVEEGRAEVERVQQEPDVSVAVEDLAATYLGAFSFTDLQRASRSDAHDPQAVAVADAMFRTPRQPWCPEIF